MAGGSIRRRATALGAVMLLSIALLASLVLMSGAIQNSGSFGALYSILLLTNTAGLLAFVVLIGLNVRRLLKQLRGDEPGARLTLRMLIIFVVLAVVPVTILYGFSLDFLRRGIDSWFDVRIGDALSGSLELGREALDARMREFLVRTENMADEFAAGPQQRATLSLDALRRPGGIVAASSWAPDPARLDAMRDRSGARELTLLGSDGKLIASSSQSGELVPHLPPDTVTFQVAEGSSYIGLDPTRDGELSVRVAVNVSLAQGRRVLYAVYPFSARVNELADSVESAYAKYNELAYLREKLKLSFAMTLTLVLLFSILTAVWAAFYSARRLSAPVRDLAKGTAAVAAGDYTTSLPPTHNDEIGFLVDSFNDMTRRIALARREVETQHTYLDTVLRQLSSGVITLSADGAVATVNDAAVRLLEIDDRDFVGTSFAEVCAGHDHLSAVNDVVATAIKTSLPQWQEQLTLFASDGRRELMCRGTALDVVGADIGGYVIVFENITAVIQGQRDAAWSEVARRLAHEIKNPLTPIQLAAERMRLKYMRKLDGDDGAGMERLTNTITQQVETMKSMVDTFSDYAKPPVINKGAVAVNPLLGEVLELFRAAHPQAEIEERFDPELPAVSGDPARLRQVFNNLVKNALEASPSPENAHIIVSTAIVNYALAEHAEIRIEDRGDGIPEDLIADVFEPYVTHKARGTGLGLAIVKKIIEEHNGVVTLRNNQDQGAVAVIRLPLETDAQPAADAVRNTA